MFQLLSSKGSTNKKKIRNGTEKSCKDSSNRHNTQVSGKIAHSQSLSKIRNDVQRTDYSSCSIS